MPAILVFWSFMRSDAGVFWISSWKSTNCSSSLSYSGVPSAASMRERMVTPGTYSVARAQEPSATWETSRILGTRTPASTTRARFRASLKMSEAGFSALNTLTMRSPST